MTVAVASGTVVIAGTEVAVTSGNVTIGTAHATLRRFDLIAVNNAGTKSCVAGTAASTPVFPAIPASSVILAAVYVPAADTTISTAQIIDKRVVVKSPLGASGWITISKATDETRTATTTLADDSTLKFTMAASTKYRIRLRVMCSQSTGTADPKFRLAGPASPDFICSRWMSPNVTSGIEGTAREEMAYSATDFVNASSAATTMVVYIDTIVHNGANAGTFSLQWAQVASDAGNTIVRAGSYLEYAVA